jgi:hypothetical protein
MLVINNAPQKTYRIAQYTDSWNRLHSLAYQEPMQGVRQGREHLPAPAPEEPLQGVRGGEHLPATPSPEDPMQGVSVGGRASTRTSARGADARSAECKPQGADLN